MPLIAKTIINITEQKQEFAKATGGRIDVGNVVIKSKLAKEEKVEQPPVKTSERRAGKLKANKMVVNGAEVVPTMTEQAVANGSERRAGKLKANKMVVNGAEVVPAKVLQKVNKPSYDETRFLKHFLVNRESDYLGHHKKV